jgi:outer membrane protein OmpA-like peptidoglycan-associated protein
MSLIDDLKRRVTPDLMRATAKRLGEGEVATVDAMGAAAAAVLYGVRQTARSGRGGAQAAALADPSNDGTVLDRLEQLFEGGEAEDATTRAIGDRLLGFVLADRKDGVSCAIARATGIKSASAATILSIAGTLVAATAGAAMRRQAITTADGVSRMLDRDGGEIDAALPDFLRPVLEPSPPAAALAATAAPPSGGRMPIAWILPAAAALFAVLWYAGLDGGGGTPAVAPLPSAQTAAPPSTAVADAPRETAALQAGARAAADERAAIAARHAAEAKAVADLTAPPAAIQIAGISEAAARAVAKACRDSVVGVINAGEFRFPRESSAITAQIRPQLDRLAAALRTCPAIRLRIEGRGDAGSASYVVRALEEGRAQAVAAYLTRAGVQRDWLETGEGHVARSGTPPLAAGIGDHSSAVRLLVGPR